VGLDPAGLGHDALAAGVRQMAGGTGADVVVETSGVADTLAVALRGLRPGGRIATAGLVVPGVQATLDASEIVRRCATIHGIHNYRPRHLVTALDFVVAHRDRLPLGELVDARFRLEEADQAFAAAASREALRPAIIP